MEFFFAIVVYMGIMVSVPFLIPIVFFGNAIGGILRIFIERRSR